MSSKYNTKENIFLYKAVLSLKTIDECAEFFDDLCTKNEILSMSQRLYVAKCLEEGNTYIEIKEKTGASSATISRVSRAVLNGHGSYKLAISRVSRKK